MMLTSDQPAPIDLNRAPTEFQRKRSRQSQASSLLVACCNAQSPQCRGAGSNDKLLADGQETTPGQHAIGFDLLRAGGATPANNSQHNTDQHSTHCPARTHHKGTEVCCCPARPRVDAIAPGQHAWTGWSSFGEIHSRLRKANAQTCILAPADLTPIGDTHLSQAVMCFRGWWGVVQLAVRWMLLWALGSSSAFSRGGHLLPRCLLQWLHGPDQSQCSAPMAALTRSSRGPTGHSHGSSTSHGQHSVAPQSWLLGVTLWSHIAVRPPWSALLCTTDNAFIRGLTPHPSSPTRVAAPHCILALWCCLAVWWFTSHSPWPESPHAPQSCFAVSPTLQWGPNSHRPPASPTSVCSRSLVWIIPTNGHDVKNRSRLYASRVDMLSVPANRISRRPIRTSKSIPRYEGYIDR